MVQQKVKGECKEKPELWVKRSLVFELPKKVEDYLEDLAKLCGTTCDEILCDELRSTLQSFYQGGFLDGWIREGFKNRSLEEELGS
jgi:16S rRNA C1402 (ribose-2'-O) methylase RsmI